MVEVVADKWRVHDAKDAFQRARRPTWPSSPSLIFLGRGRALADDPEVHQRNCSSVRYTQTDTPCVQLALSGSGIICEADGHFAAPVDVGIIESAAARPR